jgi:hypothetical protein
LQSLENDFLSGRLRDHRVIRWRILVGALIRVLGLVTPQQPIICFEVFIAPKSVLVGTLNNQGLLVEFGCPVEGMQGLLLLGRCHEEKVEEVGELTLLLRVSTTRVLLGH